jgi:tetratricopeptide (TPR) repeat protein/NAD-dependent SIR2 family protein deacetylase
VPDAATVQDVTALIVDSIRARRIVVFCGAGISFNSGLPLANHLIEAVLQKLDLNDVAHEILQPPRLPFEAFVETLRAESHVTALLDLFKLGQPNTNHILLGKLAQRQLLRTVCTTNFDALIETAFEAGGLAAGSGYSVAFKDTQFDAIPWNDPAGARLIKLHGSVADTESMAITLRQVSHHELSMHRQKVVENLFSTGEHSDVLVLGYSCSDLFDITPHIETLAKKQKRIFFVEHAAAAADGHAGEVMALSERSDRNPFRDFAGGLNIRYDTDALMAAIWRGCLDEPYRLEKSAVERSTWLEYVERWYRELITVPASRFAVLGHLLARVSAWKDAARYFKLAVDTLRADGDLGNLSGYLASLGTAYTHLNNYQAAIACHREGMEIARKTGNRLSEATNAQNLGNAYQAIGDLEEALPFHKRAADIAVELDNFEGKAATFAALGMLLSRLGRSGEAVKHLEYAIAVARQDANLAEQAKSLGSLGDVYLRVQQLDEAERCYLQSIDLARKIGLKEAEGKTLGNIGILLTLHGQFGKATDYLEQSRAIARALSDLSGEGKALGALGLCLQGQGQHRSAIDYYVAALDIARRIGDTEMAVNACLSLNSACGLIGDDVQATRFLFEATSAAGGSPRLLAHIEQTAAANAAYLASQRPSVWNKLSSWFAGARR